MKNTKNFISYISLFILIVLILIPAFILYTKFYIGDFFNSPTMTMWHLGKLTGLIGLSTFAFTLFLSSRFVWLDKLFYGLPKVINIHRWLGVISFTLILLHPLLLAFRLLPVSPQAPLSIFVIWSEAAYVFGYISILIFMVLIIMTFFWRLNYEKLKSLHSLLAVPLMLGGVHGILIDSDIKNIPGLAIYYIVIISISTLLYLARLFLVNYGIKAQKFTIEKIDQASKNTWQISLKPNKKNIPCQAGQFVFVSFPDIKKNEEHPFSIASIENDGRITIITKSLGDYTAKMANLKIGNLAMVDGAYGRFGDNADKNCHQIWIAGGIGITPFISMAKNFAEDQKSQGQVDLFYITASENDLVGLNILQELATNCPRFKLNTYISDKEGRFDIGKLKYFVGSIDNCHFYICGPQGMMKYFVNTLKKNNIPNKNINIEAFQLL